MNRRGERFRISGGSSSGRAGGSRGAGGSGKASETQAGLTGRPWLSIWFNCCRTYSRIYRNRTGTMYEGRCPRCGGHVRALIGPDGESRRLYETK